MAGTLAALAIAAAGSPARADHLVGVSLDRRVVVAVDTGTAYVAAAGGGLAALDLASGEARWTSSAAALPVALTDTELLAQADPRGASALELVALAPGSGARLAARTVELPPNVIAAVSRAPGRSFAMQATGHEDGVRLYWSSTFSPSVRGFDLDAREPAGGSSAPVSRSGVIEVSLSGSGLAAASLDDSDTAPHPLIEELIGDRLVGSASGREFLSADGRHVLLSELADGGGLLERYRWSIYSRSDGTLLGSVSSHLAAMPFVVAGGSLIHVSPRFAFVEKGVPRSEPVSLRVHHLASGTELWSRAIREDSFQGPFPP